MRRSRGWPVPMPGGLPDLRGCGMLPADRAAGPEGLPTPVGAKSRAALGVQRERGTHAGMRASRWPSPSSGANPAGLRFRRSAAGGAAFAPARQLTPPAREGCGALGPGRACCRPSRPRHSARGMEGGPPPDAPPSPRAWTPPPSGRSVGGGKPVGHGSGAAASERCAVGRAARDQGRRVGPFPRPSGSHAPTAVRTDAPAVTGGPWLGVGVEPCGVAVPRDQPAGRASSGGGARGALCHACTAPTLVAGCPSALPAGASSGDRPPRVPAGQAPPRRGGACRSGRTERGRRVGPRVVSGRAGSGRPVPDLSRPEKRRR